MNSLLETCAFLDPRFKDIFTMEQETVVTLMNEIKCLMKLKGMEQPTEDYSSAPPRKKGKFPAANHYNVYVLFIYNIDFDCNVYIPLLFTI